MTDKELHKLGRRELLQLLVSQGLEAEKVRQELAETQEKLKETQAGYEKLRGRLDEKDAEIQQREEEMEAEYEKLRRRLDEKDAEILQKQTEMEAKYTKLCGRLDDKDAQIQQLRDTLREEREEHLTQAEEVGSIAEASLRLNGIFEAAQKAADQYLLSVRQREKQRTNPAKAAEPSPMKKEDGKRGKDAKKEERGKSAEESDVKKMEVVEVVDGKRQPQSRTLYWKGISAQQAYKKPS